MLWLTVGSCCMPRPEYRMELCRQAGGRGELDWAHEHLLTAHSPTALPALPTPN
jgi:hypothetical protein